MLALIRRFQIDQTASTSIEYAIIASLLSIAIVGSVTALGSGVSGLFDLISGTL